MSCLLCAVTVCIVLSMSSSPTTGAMGGGDNGNPNSGHGSLPAASGKTRQSLGASGRQFGTTERTTLTSQARPRESVETPDLQSTSSAQMPSQGGFAGSTARTPSFVPFIPTPSSSQQNRASSNPPDSTLPRQTSGEVTVRQAHNDQQHPSHQTTHISQFGESAIASGGPASASLALPQQQQPSRKFETVRRWARNARDLLTRNRHQPNRLQRAREQNPPQTLGSQDGEMAFAGGRPSGATAGRSQSMVDLPSDSRLPPPQPLMSESYVWTTQPSGSQETLYAEGNESSGSQATLNAEGNAMAEGNEPQQQPTMAQDAVAQGNQQARQPIMGIRALEIKMNQPQQQPIMAHAIVEQENPQQQQPVIVDDAMADGNQPQQQPVMAHDIVEQENQQEQQPVIAEDAMADENQEQQQAEEI